MKKDKANYISEQREALRQYLDDYASDKNSRNSASAISRSLGVSATMLSQFINMKYPGDNASLANKIEAFLKRQDERTNYTEIFPEALPTKNVQRIHNLCRICHLEGEMGVITGDAGLSKTTGLKAYQRNNQGSVILIEVIPGTTAKNLAIQIHKECGYDGRGTQWDMSQDIIEKLKNSERLIIIDEAEHLPTTALELARRIHDKTNIGVVLAGLPKLLMNLRGLKSDFRQLYSRIGVKAELKNLEESDVKLLVQAAQPNSNGAWKYFYEQTQNGRTLSKLIKMAIKVSKTNNRPIDASVVEAAKEYLIV